MKSVKNLRELTIDELRNQLRELLNQQFRMRIEKATQQLRETHKLAIVRKQVARVKTLIHEKLFAVHVGKDS